MQITNSVVCGAIKGCIYKQIKPPLVGEHAFPLTGFVCKEAHVTTLKPCAHINTRLLFIHIGEKPRTLMIKLIDAYDYVYVTLCLNPEGDVRRVHMHVS